MARIDELSTWARLDWETVFGTEWQTGARDLARYFGKQLGCMLSAQQLPVPDELVEFLDGNDWCPSICFMLYINPRAVNLHEQMTSEGDLHGLSGFVGLLASEAFQTADGVFSGVNYGYHIGYLWFIAEWRAGTSRHSWFKYQVIDLPRLVEAE